MKGLNGASKDVVLCVCEFLHPMDVVHLAGINHNLRRVCTDEQLWEKMCHCCRIQIYPEFGAYHSYILSSTGYHYKTYVGRWRLSGKRLWWFQYACHILSILLSLITIISIAMLVMAVYSPKIQLNRGGFIGWIIGIAIAGILSILFLVLWLKSRVRYRRFLRIREEMLKYLAESPLHYDYFLPEPGS